MLCLHSNYFFILQVGEAENSARLSDKNNLARLINSEITVSTLPLEPLYGADGKPIPNFPETGADVKKLKGEGPNFYRAKSGLI